MNHYKQAEEKAGDDLRALLALPMPDPEAIGECGRFDPWEIFPALYGTYGGDFDKCAIEVLREIRDKEKRRDDLGAEMFREMLCIANLCEYGASPRVCFATLELSECIDELIKKWVAFSLLHWKQDVCAED